MKKNTRGKKAGSKSKYEDAMKELARNERMKESKNELLQRTYFVSSFSRLVVFINYPASKVSECDDNNPEPGHTVSLCS